MTPKQAAKAAAKYESVENMVHMLILAYYRRHGGDWDEVRSAGLLGYAKAAATHKKRKGAFTTWVWKHVQQEMSNDAAMLRQQKRALPYAYGDPAGNRDYPSFPLVEFRRQLSRRAVAAVDLALFPTDDIEVIAQEKGGHANNYRSTIRMWLWRIGWSEEEVNVSFAEIRRAIWLQYQN